MGGALVHRGIPISRVPEEVAKMLVAENASRWSGLTQDDLHSISCERLNRRIQGGIASKDAGWVASTAVKVLALSMLCDAILADRGAVLDFGWASASVFQPTQWRCFWCGQLGSHIAHFCRNPPQ